MCVDEERALVKSVWLRYRQLAKSVCSPLVLQAKVLGREGIELLDRGGCSLPAQVGCVRPNSLARRSESSLLLTVFRWADGCFRAYDEVWGALGDEL